MPEGPGQFSLFAHQLWSTSSSNIQEYVAQTSKNTWPDIVSPVFQLSGCTECRLCLHMCACQSGLIHAIRKGCDEHVLRAVGCQAGRTRGYNCRKRSLQVLSRDICKRDCRNSYCSGIDPAERCCTWNLEGKQHVAQYPTPCLTKE